MAEYTYAREIDSTGNYNIDNTLYVDGDGEMIHLCGYLEGEITGVKFDMVCSGADVTITSDVTLDSAQETALTAAIVAYKAEPLV